MPWKPDYVTLSEMKGHEHIPDTADDTEISEKITAASRAVDTWCKRQFGKLDAPAARVYRERARYDRRTGFWRMDIDDLQTVTGLTVDGVAYALATAVLRPENAPADGMPWTQIAFEADPNTYGGTLLPSISIVGTWGWSAVPAQVKTATKIQATRWLVRRESPYGVAGSPNDGSEVRLTARLDPDVRSALAGLRRRPKVG